MLRNKLSKNQVQQKEIKNPIIIEADFIRESRDSLYLDCEGDLEWFPKSQVNFDVKKKELEAPKWLLEKKFPNTKF